MPATGRVGQVMKNPNNAGMIIREAIHGITATFLVLDLSKYAIKAPTIVPSPPAGMAAFVCVCVGVGGWVGEWVGGEGVERLTPKSHTFPCNSPTPPAKRLAVDAGMSNTDSMNLGPKATNPYSVRKRKERAKVTNTKLLLLHKSQRCIGKAFTWFSRESSFPYLLS